MWSMPVDLTETENENDSTNQNLQNDVAALATQADGIISLNKPLRGYAPINCRKWV